MTQPTRPPAVSGAGGHGQKYFLDEGHRALIWERYDGTTARLDEIMVHFPAVPRYIVRRWASQMGCSHIRERYWSPQDEEQLARLLPTTSIKALAKHFGRSQTAVRLKAKRLGLTKTAEGYTMYSLMEGLGLTNHRRVHFWIAQGWLKGRRRHSLKERDMWYFTDKNIRDFVAAHPGEIDPRRFDWMWLADVLFGGRNGLGSLSDTAPTADHSPADMEQKRAEARRAGKPIPIGRGRGRPRTRQVAPVTAARPEEEEQEDIAR